ncbi:MAG TPA: autotransporter-associated beta strand repeat-containing protein, partial [Verrucomicrobiae bacterium]
MKTQNQRHPLLGSIGFPHSGRARQHLAAGLLLLGSVGIAAAAEVKLTTNDPAGSSSFNSAGKWSDAATPSVGNAYFTTNFTLRTPNPTTSGNTYVFGGDSLSIDSGGRFLAKIGNNVSGNTTVGTITVNQLILNGGSMDQAGANSDHSVLIVGGNVSVNAASIIGALGGTANGSSTFETVDFIAPISGSGALQVSGPNINGGGDTGLIKLSAPNPYNGTITVSAGNGNVIASAVDRILQLNHLNALSNATLNLNSAQASPVSFATAVNVGAFNLGALAGTSDQTLNDTAGSPVTLSVGGNNASTTYSGALTDGGNLVKVGSGTLTLAGANTFFGTTIVEGGSLQLGDGGAGGSLTSGNILTLNGNLTVNRNNSVMQGVDFSGSAITGTGSFTQAGSGTTTLNAANSYSGVTTVSAGKLVISSAQTGTGAILVADGAALRVSVSGGSQLSPGSLTLGTSAGTVLEIDGVSSTTTAPINAGAVSAGGLVTVNITSGTFAAGNNYPLVHWTGSGPANASSFALGISPGLTANLSVSGSTLYLNVSAVSDIWAGLTDGNWDTSTANWIGHASIFANGDSVLFDDTAFNNFVTVNAAVQPGSILFNNSESFPYSVVSSGGNNISGSAGLTKINSGSLTLSGGANTYTGATEINGGILSVSTLANGGLPSDIGAASADSANLVLNNGKLQYTGGSATIDRGATLSGSGATAEIVNAVNLNDSGVIVGSGSLTKTGFGTLTLSGANTFSGGVTLSEGELDINYGGSSSANSAIGVGPLTIATGTIIDNTSGSDVTLLSNNAQVWNGSFIFGGFGNNLNLGAGPVTLPATCTVTVYGNTLTVGGTISGAGGLTKAGFGTLVLSGVNALAGTVNLTEGTLAIGNDFALGTGQLNLNGGGVGAIFQSVDGAAHTITNNVNFGGSAGANIIFGGSGNLKFTDDSIANGSAKVLTVNNPQTEFTGTLSGSNARTVSGTGILILSGANTYSAGTTINPGATLQLGNG